MNCRFAWLPLVFCVLWSAVPLRANEVIRSAQSGPWSAPETWVGGKVPTSGARVHVLSGHTVTYDVASDDVIRAINIAGTLTFSPDRDTKLNVGLIKI